MKSFIIAVLLGLSVATVSISGCAVGGHVGPVGGSASVG